MDHNVACDAQSIKVFMLGILNFASTILIHSFIVSLILIIIFITKPIRVIIIINFFVFKHLLFELHHRCLILNSNFKPMLVISIKVIIQFLRLVRERIINFVLQVFNQGNWKTIINLIQYIRRRLCLGALL